MIQVGLHARYVQVAGPARHHQGRHAVADQVGQCARFGHEAVEVAGRPEPVAVTVVGQQGSFAEVPTFCHPFWGTCSVPNGHAISSPPSSADRLPR